MFAKSAKYSRRNTQKAPARIQMHIKLVGCLLFCLLTSLTTGVSVLAEERYIFVLPSLANPYWQTIKQGIEDASKESGVKSVVLSAANDQAKEEFLNLCQAAISQSPAMIVICTTADTITLQCLREAQNKRIKVAVLDNVIPDGMLKKAGINLSFAIGTDNVMIGERAAQFIADKNKLAAPKILVLEGVVGNTCSTNRVSGFKQGINRSLPKAKIVTSVSAEWDRLKAMNITADTLNKVPDLNFVFAANDMMALGAAEAIRHAKKTEQIAVVGVDGVADARKAILAGRLTASVAQLPYLIGKRSVELAKESVHGRCSGKSERTPLLVLTKNVLESHTDPLLKYVR